MGLFTIFLWVVSTAVSYTQAKKAKDAARRAAEDAAGVLVNKESNDANIPVIYGRRRVGGTRVYVSSKDVAGGDKNEYLYIALAMCEGEINSISDIEIDDVSISNSKFNGLISYNIYTGSDTQAADPLLLESSAKWTAAHTLKGTAYIAIRFKWLSIQEQEDTDRENPFSGIPSITAIIEGRKVYDPRTGNTAYSTNPALCIRDYLTNARYGKGLAVSNIDDVAFSTAADDFDTTVAYVTGDSILGKLYEINAVLDSGKDLFDNVNIMLTGCRGFLPRSQGKYGLYMDKARSSVMTLDESKITKGIKVVGEKKANKFNQVRVTFVNPENKWQNDQAIWPPKDSAQSTQFLAEDGAELIFEIDMQTCTNYYSALDLARVLCLRSRNAKRVVIETTSEAFALAVPDVISISHSSPGFASKPFQIESLGLNSDGSCVIAGVEYDTAIYAYDNDVRQRVYEDTTLPNPSVVARPTNLTSTITTLLGNDGSSITAIRLGWDFALDSFVNKYEVQWQRGEVNYDDGFVTEDHTESLDDGFVYDSATVFVDDGFVYDALVSAEPTYNSAETATNQFEIKGTIPGQNYNVRIRSLNTNLGFSSDWASISTVAAGDTTPPGLPAGFAAAGGLGEITLTWVPPSDSDFHYVEVLENNTNNRATATVIASEASGSTYVRTGLGYNQLRYYWIRAFDYSLNASDYTAEAHATTSFVDADAFSQEVMSLFSEAGAYGIQPVTALPAAGDFDGQIVFLNTSSAKKLYRWDAANGVWTDDIFSISAGSVDAASFASGIEPITVVNTLPNPVGYTGTQLVFLTADYKVYRYTGTEFISTIDSGDLAGTIGEGNFPQGLRPVEIVSVLPTTGNFDGRQCYLTSDKKLYRFDGTAFVSSVSAVDISGSITQSQLGVDSVTSAQIAANAVLTSSIDGNAITNALIATDAVNSDSIAANSVTAVSISAGAVNSDKIEAGAVVAGSIAAGAIVSEKIAADAITANKIAANAVTANAIAANAVTANEIAAGAVTADAILAGSIEAGAIAVGAVTAEKIAADAITANKIAANAVTAGAIAAGSVTADALDVNIINSTHIQSGSIQTDDIAANSITAGLLAATGIITDSAQIEDLVVGTAQIDDVAITSAKIANLAVDTLQIAGNAVTIPSNTETASSVTFGGTSQTLILTHTFIGSGAPAEVLFVCTAGGRGATNLTLICHHNNSFQKQQAYSYGGVIVFPVLTAAGFNTIKIYGRLSSSQYTCTIPTAYVRTLETKK